MNCDCEDCLECELRAFRGRTLRRRGQCAAPVIVPEAPRADARAISRATHLPYLEVLECLAEGRSPADLLEAFR